MAKKNGKYLNPDEPARPRRGDRRKKTNRKAVRVILIVLAVVFCAALIGLGIWQLRLAKARSDFRKLAAIVRQNTVETSAPAETTPPAAQPTQTPADPSAQTEPVTEPVTEPEPTEPVMLPQYAALYEQNDDLFGWLRIDGTIIDYPVMHTPGDPEKYLHTNFAGEYSFGGIPFIDAACSADSDNLLIYGHNMLDGSMFRSLMKYQEKTYWQAHPIINFDTLYEQGEYEVLAAFYDRVYYQYETCFKFYQFIDALDETDFNEAIANFKSKALYDTGVTAAYGDKLITLVTCAYHVDNGRFVVVARKK